MTISDVSPPSNVSSLSDVCAGYTDNTLHSANFWLDRYYGRYDVKQLLLLCENCYVFYNGDNTLQIILPLFKYCQSINKSFSSTCKITYTLELPGEKSKYVCHER